MIFGQRDYTALFCATLALVSAALLVWLWKRPEENPIPQALEPGVHVGELTKRASIDKTDSEPSVVALAPTVVRRASVAMVPPQVREAEDATAKVETLPRVEDDEAVLFTKTSAATLRALADDPAANTLLRLTAKCALSNLSERDSRE